MSSSSEWEERILDLQDRIISLTAENARLRELLQQARALVEQYEPTGEYERILRALERLLVNTEAE